LDNLFKVSGLENEYRDWISSLISDIGVRYRNITDEHIRIIKDKYLDLFMNKIKDVYLFFLTEDQILQITKFWSSPSGMAYSSSKIKVKLTEEMSDISSSIISECNSILNGERNG